MNKTLILIDAYNQIYRGFHAIPVLSNSKGEPTNAVFAFCRFLLSLEKTCPSGYGAVVYDLGKSGKRLAVNPLYKAGRAPMPETMKPQLPLIRKAVALAGWPILEQEGIEADDIIGAVAARFADREIKIVSSDKDLSQIIGERVKMLVPDIKGGFVIRGKEEVFAKFAVRPEQIVDYLSLVGDSSDNIRGVDGVGPKTAAKLLAEFGTLDNLIARLQEVKSVKMRESIAANLEKLGQNRSIIKLDLDISPDAWKTEELLKRRTPDWDGLARFADELEMRSISDGIKKIVSQKDVVAAPVEVSYTPDLFNF